MEQNETRTLWLSIASAVFAVVLLYGWAQDKRATMARKFGQTKTVVVARQDIREMEIIDESKLEVVEKPADFIQPLAVQNPTEIVGQIALAPIKMGEQILETKLVLPGESTGLSFQVSPGKRASTISVNNVNSVAKLIKPGDHVDVIVAIDDGKGVDKIRKVKTLIQNVPVLATGQSIVDNIPLKVRQGDEENFEIRNLRVENDYSTITLEVTPSEAQQLFYLISINNPISLTLRNPNDHQAWNLQVADVDNVMNRTKLRVPAKASSDKKKIKSKSAPKPKEKSPTKKRGRYEQI